MSSLRNAIPRRPHKERAQEHGRQKHGLLEKHKDYSLRAKDHNEKKARLKILRQKATDRNPDEFHFAMMSSKTKNGIKIADRGNKALSMDVVKLLKTQDAGYLRTMLQRTRNERGRLEQEIVLGGKGGEDGTDLSLLKGAAGKQGNNHKVFVNDEVEQETFDPAEWFGTDAEGVKKSYNRPRAITEENIPDLEETAIIPARQKGPRELEQERMAMREERARLKRRQREQASRKAQLQALRSRERDLALAEEELELQRAKMINNAGGVNKNGVKFKTRERKR